MIEKQTNLCVAVDVTSTASLVGLIDAIGPHICILKMHIDILEDFDAGTLIPTLLKLKDKHHFLIFEDRKFADIGSTVAHQYGGGVYRISEWADLVTVHSVPGPGIISGLKSVAAKCSSERGILLLSEMSSAGNLCTREYAECTVAMAHSEQDFVVGFISQSRTDAMPSQSLVLTPGVSMAAKGDSMGQQYKTPGDAIEKGADIVIVGRGIYGAENVLEATMRYKEAGWSAYLKAVQS